MSAHKTSKTFTLKGFWKLLLLLSCGAGPIIIIIVILFYFFLHMSFQFSSIEHDGKKWNLQPSGLGLYSGESMLYETWKKHESKIPVGRGRPSEYYWVWRLLEEVPMSSLYLKGVFWQGGIW